MTALLESNIPGFTPRRGKVRDIYDFGDRLLLVATDRISAFDHVLPNGIPDKGRVLTKISEFWFRTLGTKNHLIDMDVSTLPQVPPECHDDLAGRSMVVQKTTVIPIECVVRGYLTGSGLKEYRTSQTVCGIPLPDGLVDGSKLPEPIFTPATKEESGHDVNISFDQMREIIDPELADFLRSWSIQIYKRGAAIAAEHGITIADTKFEFGEIAGQLSNEQLLIDEVLTPDSSRFWPSDAWQPGQAQLSFDKQFVRDWLVQSGWDKESPPPELPDDVIVRTREKYIEAYERLTQSNFPWK